MTKVALTDKLGRISFVDENAVCVGEWIKTPYISGFIVSIYGKFVTVDKNNIGIFVTLKIEA